MEAQLKALKVPELKAVLTKAGVKPAAKATKADLVKTILENPAACDAFSGSNSGGAPTEEPSIVAEPATAEPEVTVPPAAAAAAPATTTSGDTPTTTEPVAALDADAEARRKRAERFGIPFVENPVVPGPDVGKRGRKGKGGAAKTVEGGEKPKAQSKQANDDPEKLKARADRFGTSQPAAEIPAAKASNGGRKRKSPAPVDPEEEERRRKRAERFGIPVAAAKS